MLTKMQSQATDSQKIPAKYVSDKELTAKVYKEFSKLNNENTNNAIFLKMEKICTLSPKKRSP